MKKIFALACAASALAITSAADAESSIGSKGDQFSVAIKGTVPGYCTLSSPSTFNVSNGSYTPSGGSNGTGTFDISNLGNAGGLVQGWSATGSFQITANESCNLSLISANGGLKNTSNTSANNISYNAVVYDSQSSATPVQVTTPNMPFSSFNSKFDPVNLGNETVNFGVSISPGSNPVAAGVYQDTLTLIVNPTI